MISSIVLILVSTIALISLVLVESSFIPTNGGSSNRIPCRRRLETLRCATSREPSITTVESTNNEAKKKHYSPPTARSVAVSVFTKQKGNEEFILARLDVDQAFHSLEQRDRSFARLLVTVAARRLGQIDKMLAIYTNMEGRKNVCLLVIKKYESHVSLSSHLFITSVFFFNLS
jgi:hypothetical protein